MGYIAPKKILAADASFAPYPIIPEQTGNCVTYLDLVQFGKLTEFTEIGVIGGTTNPSSPDDFSIDPIDIGDAENTQITQSANKEHWTTFFNVISNNIKRLKLMHNALKEKIEAYDPPTIILSNNTGDHIISATGSSPEVNTFNNVKNSICWTSLNNNICIANASNPSNIQYNGSTVVGNYNNNSGTSQIKYYLINNYKDKFAKGHFILSADSSVEKGNSTAKEISVIWVPDVNKIQGAIVANLKTYKMGVINVELPTCGARPDVRLDITNEMGDRLVDLELTKITSPSDPNTTTNNKHYQDSPLQWTGTYTLPTSIYSADKDIEKIFIKLDDQLTNNYVVSNTLTINVIDNTYACWYIGTSIPSGDVPINSNLADGIGWRNIKKNGEKISYSNLIGNDGNSAFNSLSPIWDGAANPIIINSNSGTTAYICIPFTEEMIVGSGSRATVKILIRDTDEDQLQNWVMQTTGDNFIRVKDANGTNTNIYYKELGTNNKHKFIIYKATNIKIFNGTIF